MRVNSHREVELAGYALLVIVWLLVYFCARDNVLRRREARVVL